MGYVVQILVPINIKIIDNTCGPSPISGGGVEQNPPYNSKKCDGIRCQREKNKPPCLILNLKTGDPYDQPQPKYCKVECE